jgi:predicted transcriptional regulator
LSKIKIQDKKNLLRDQNSGAILNTDLSEVIAYKNKKNEINKVSNLENKVSKIESELGEIKNYLKTLFERNSNQ